MNDRRPGDSSWRGVTECKAGPRSHVKNLLCGPTSHSGIDAHRENVVLLVFCRPDNMTGALLDGLDLVRQTAKLLIQCATLGTHIPVPADLG